MIKAKSARPPKTVTTSMLGSEPLEFPIGFGDSSFTCLDARRKLNDMFFAPFHLFRLIEVKYFDQNHPNEPEYSMTDSEVYPAIIFHMLKDQLYTQQAYGIKS